MRAGSQQIRKKTTLANLLDHFQFPCINFAFQRSFSILLWHYYSCKLTSHMLWLYIKRFETKASNAIHYLRITILFRYKQANDMFFAANKKVLYILRLYFCIFYYWYIGHLTTFLLKFNNVWTLILC